MKKKNNLSKNKFLLLFITFVLVLAIIRFLFPSIANNKCYSDLIIKKYKDFISISNTRKKDSIDDEKRIKELSELISTNRLNSVFYDKNKKLIKNRIYGVLNYDECFPDSQPIQLKAAMKYAIRAVKDRRDAEIRKKELVYIGSNPYYKLKKLTNSVPYLTPRAAILLQDIAHNFFDSLQIKHIPLTKIYVTSVLRTKKDVQLLIRHNKNATINSCHLYGTTFDISYNKYATLTRTVGTDTLKYVLSEVLNDLRKQGRCFIKHEKHQGCFHITIR